MKINPWYMISVLTWFVSNCPSSYAFDKHSDGIIMTLKKNTNTDPERIKIQVCSDDIIRIIAAPGESFSLRQSLMVDKTDWEPVKWSLKEQDDQIILSTSKVNVKINKESGTIGFYDSKDKLILLEKVEGGKIITPAEVMGEKTYHIQQIFHSPEDEAFYGLGQHQNNIMNYKGHDLDLWQHNIVAVVPFLVSSNHYGILWDNYSRTKFGDIRDFQSLSLLKHNNDAINIHKSIITTKGQHVINAKYATDMELNINHMTFRHINMLSIRAHIRSTYK